MKQFDFYRYIILIQKLAAGFTCFTVAALSFLLLLLFNFSASAQEPKLMLPIGHTAALNSAVFSPDGKKVVTASGDRTAKIWDAKTGALLADLRGHTWGVHFAAFSPDGKKIATASYDTTAKIWDAQTGALLTDLKGHTADVHSVMFSPDGKKIVTASKDSTAKIWDAQTGALLANLKGHKNNVLTATFSPDGEKIQTTSSDNTAKIWDAQTGALLIDINEHSDYVYSAAFSPDGKKVISASNDTTAIWDAQTGRLLAVLKGHTDYINSVPFSPDGKKVVTASLDSTAKIWDAETGALLVNLKGHTGGVHSAVFSPDGKKIATASYDTTAKIWDAQTGILLADLKEHKADVSCVTFSPDGKKIVTASKDKTAKIWDAQTGTLLADLKGHASAFISAAFSPDGKKILDASADGTAKIWDAQTGVLLADLRGHTGGVWRAAFSADGKKIVTASWDKSAKIWDAQTGALLADLKGHTERVNSAAFSPDGKKIVTASGDRTVKIWDAQTGIALASLDIYDYGYDATFSADGKKIVTSSANKTAKIWDAQTGALLADLKGHTSSVLGATFSPDGKKIVTASLDSTAKIWDAQTGALLADLKGHTHGVNGAVFSPDGKIIVTSSWDNTPKIWNSQTGALLADLKGHTKGVYSAAFSPDGKKIITTSEDNTAKIWDAQTGAMLANLAGHTRDINSAVFSPDGKKIVTASSDNTAKIWNAETGNLLYTFFSVDSADYLVTDQYGRYDGTEGARKLLYYTCGTEVIGLEQFKDLSWEPGLAAKIMDVNKEPITAKKLSEINICNYTPEIEQKGILKGIYHFEIKPRAGGIGEVQLFVNSKLVKSYPLSSLSKHDSIYDLSFDQKEVIPYFTNGADNQVLVKATTLEGTMTSRGATIESAAEKKNETNPNLYLVSIGVSKYKGEALKLAYASKDAADFASAVAASAKKLLNTDGKEHVTVCTFNTGAGSARWPAKIVIQKTMDSIAEKATADDILIIFFAGHGVLQSGQKNLYLLTAEASAFELSGVEKDVAISTDELNTWMRKIKAHKQLLILDACNSGQAIKNLQDLIGKREVPADQQRALENLKDKTGTFILSASASGQSAYETSLYGQGLLTYSLLSAIKLGTGLKENKYIDVTKWFNTASDNVRIMAKDIGGRQEPQILGSASFDVGLVDKEVVDGIKLSIKRKIISRSRFLGDADALSDELNLSGLVDKELNNLSARGEESQVAYVADNTLIDSYSIRGRYVITGNDVAIKISLYKGQKEKLYSFDLAGRVNNTEGLAKSIVEKINDVLHN